MRETVIRLIATAAILCGGTNLGWAQEAGTLHGRELVALGNRLPMWLIQTHESWSKRGVYALFASRSGLAILEAGGFRAGSDRLVYVGKTENSFAERLARHRTGGSNLSAPLKRALGANATQLEVSRFIQTHLKVGLLPLDDRARINAVETELIKSRGPPLNTAGVNGAGGTPVIRTTSGIRTMRMLVKGAAIIAAAEVPITIIVETLHVQNGRKSTEEALAEGGRNVGTAAAVGATIGAIAAGAATAGVTIPAAVPISVVAGGAYVWVSGKRIWNAIDDETKGSVTTQINNATAAVENGLSTAGTMFRKTLARATATVKEGP